MREDFASHDVREGVVDRVREAGVNLRYDADEPVGKTIAALFEAIAEEHLMQPTIIYEFPTAVSPLSKQKPDEPDWTERFEIFAGKMEIANGFSELNDPEDQRRRFEAQFNERERGDEEAHQMDENYIRRCRMACLRRAAWAWGSTGWRCCSRTRTRFGM